MLTYQIKQENLNNSIGRAIKNNIHKKHIQK